MVSFAFPVMLPPQAKSFFSAVRLLIPLNFITLHYIYYIVVCIISAVIFWGSSTPAQSVSFIDSLFFTVSAMTQAGLNTVNLSQLNTWQQFILFFLILVGSSVLISSAVVHIRKVAFERRFTSVIEEERRRRKTLKGTISAPFSRSRSMKSTVPNGPTSPFVDGVVVRGRPIPPEPARTQENGKEETSDKRNHQSAPAQEHEKEDSDKRTTHHQDEEPEAAESTKVGDHEAERQTPAEEPASVQASGNHNKDERRFLPPEINHIKFAETDPSRIMSPQRLHHSPTAMSRENLHYHVRAPRTPRSEGFRLTSETRNEFRSTSKYFDSDGVIGRNSQFHSLSLDERERLGGVEYRALVLLEVIVIAYYVLFQLIGSLGIGAWIAYNASETTLENGLNPWWVGAFLAVSAFNNNGMSLLDANMVAFQHSTYILLTVGLLILAGNTCYPIFLRLVLWSLIKVLPDMPYFDDYKQTLRFLLDHPRRCYTTLFPTEHTWWLLGSLIALNGIDWIAFEVLNIDNNSLYSDPSTPWALDGLFQALAVRSGGFYVVPIANLRSGLLVLYVLMMYISVYPVTITIRNSNVYEERSLGIYADDPGVESEKASTKLSGLIAKFRRSPQKVSRSYFVRQQLQGQLAFDLWWLCLAVLFITIIETQQFGRDPITFATFNIIFEIVSAYGTVGISTGAPGVAFSFCGEWHILSKLILCAVMLRGRHRGLPVAIDRAVLLPGEHLERAEEEDAALRREITLERRTTQRQDSPVLSFEHGHTQVR